MAWQNSNSISSERPCTGRWQGTRRTKLTDSLAALSGAAAAAPAAAAAAAAAAAITRAAGSWICALLRARAAFAFRHAATQLAIKRAESVRLHS